MTTIEVPPRSSNPAIKPSAGSFSKFPVLLPVGLLVLLVAVAYANSLRGVFVFDDIGSIVQNPHLASLWPLSRAMSAPADTTPAGRPLVCLSLAVNHAFGGLETRGYHLFNIAVHALAALTLFGLVRRTLALPGSIGQTPWDERSRTAFAFAVAALWALHPLQTESVTYIVQRAESLMGFCYWFTLYAALRAAGAGSARRGGWWAAGSVVACVAGMLCKESMVTAPVAVVLFDLAFLANPWRNILARRWQLYIGLALSWIVLAIIMAGAPRGKSVGIGLAGVTSWAYLTTQCGVIVHYLALTFWPSPQVLDYAWPLARDPWDWVPQACLLTIVLADAVFIWRWKPFVGFTIVFFFLALAPTSSVVPVATEIAAEHRMYLPLAAPVILLVAGAWALMGKLQISPGSRRGILAGALALALAAEGGATWNRNRDYASEMAIWADTVRKQPANPRALVNLARAWENAGQPDRALELLKVSLSLQPDSFEALYNRGTLLAQAGRAVEAADCLEAAVRVRPDDAGAQINLGGVRLLLGDTTRARDAYERALVLNPAASGAHYNLARLDVIAGDATRACAHLEECLRTDPSNAAARRLAEAIQCSSAQAH